MPLIMRWPGKIPAGQRSAALVELMDLAPTLLDAAGLPAYAGMQGRSLWSLITGQAPPDHHRDDVYSEYYNAMPWHVQPTVHVTMVRTPRHKLVRIHGLDTGELYDLEHDPQETHNLWSDPAYGQVQMRLLQQLCDRMAWTVDPLPRREAAW